MWLLVLISSFSLVSSFFSEEIAFCAIILISVNVYYLCCVIFVNMSFNLEVLQEQ